jgi:hypothetical protein
LVNAAIAREPRQPADTAVHDLQIQCVTRCRQTLDHPRALRHHFVGICQRWRAHRGFDDPAARRAFRRQQIQIVAIDGKVDHLIRKIRDRNPARPA